MQVGRFACIAEVTNTSGNLSAYAAAPGRYQLRMTVGEEVHTQDFEILIDPRLEGIASDPLAEYRALDELSASLFQGAEQMQDGVLELRRAREQIDFVLGVAETDEVAEGAGALAEALEEWESRILQKYLETSQNNYMFEARLLVKFKDLLGRMSGANIPVTAGVREVTGDYLDEWAGHRADLVSLRDDIRAFNEVLRAAGLPEIYLGGPRPIT
jgi:hypothetical protein